MQCTLRGQNSLVLFKTYLAEEYIEYAHQLNTKGFIKVKSENLTFFKDYFCDAILIGCTWLCFEACRYIPRFVCTFIMQSWVTSQRVRACVTVKCTSTCKTRRWNAWRYYVYSFNETVECMELHVLCI